MFDVDFSNRNRSAELINFIVLEILAENGYSNFMVFQGGNCERFVYGNSRFSTDMDFVVSKERVKNISIADLVEVLKKNIPKYIRGKFSIVKDNKPDDMVKKICIRFYSDDRNTKKIECPIEIVFGIPNYTSRYSFVRNSTDTIGVAVFVMAEELHEILADKIVAFGGRKIRMSSSFKARDIWDLYWMFSNDVKLDIGMVAKKIKDYNLNSSDFKHTYLTRLKEMKDPKCISLFQGEMDRFADEGIRHPIADKNIVKSILFMVSSRMEEIFGQIEKEISKNSKPEI